MRKVPCGRVASMLPIFLLFCSFTEIACDRNPSITEEQVQNTLKSLDDALLSKDTKAVEGLLSEDFSIRVVTPGLNRPRIDYLDRHDYVRNLKISFRSCTPLSFEREGVSVEITDNGKSAKATYKLHKKEKKSGQLKRSLTQDTAVLELQAGRLIITSLYTVKM